MRRFFSTFGKVIDATVMVDRETGRGKGFGFVTFEDAVNSDQLVGKIGLMLDDKQVGFNDLQFCRPPTNIARLKSRLLNLEVNETRRGRHPLNLTVSQIVRWIPPCWPRRQ